MPESVAPEVGACVQVAVPASSANLGPGFDSVGLALGVWDECRVTVTETPGLEIAVEGEGASAVPRDSSHLVVRTMLQTWRALGVEAPSGLKLDCRNAVPHGRGMGSSATAIVTGIIAAQALSHPIGDGEDVDRAFTNDLAARLEGHPDNASASIFGGVTLSISDESSGSTHTVPLTLHPELDPVVFVPGQQLSTAKARSVLPAHVRLADAAANSARTAFLMHALTQDPSLLLIGTRDLLHQEARRPSYAASMALVDTLRSRGHAAVISGAGPSVLVLCSPDAHEDVAQACPAGWRALTPGVPAHGANVRAVATT